MRCKVATFKYDITRTVSITRGEGFFKLHAKIPYLLACVFKPLLTRELFELAAVRFLLVSDRVLYPRGLRLFFPGGFGI